MNDITAFLDLEDSSIIIEDVTTSGRLKTITLSTKPEIRFCPQCGSRMHSRGLKVRKINHPIMQDTYRVVLHLKQRRWRCTNELCGREENETFNFIGKRRRNSSASDFLIVNEFRDLSKSAADIARRFNTSDSYVHNVFDRYVNMKRLALSDVISIDEVYLNMDQYCKYVLVIQDFRTGEPIDLLRSRRQNITEPYFASIPKEERFTVEYLITDMNNSYLRYVERYFPNAEPVVDSFHVIQWLIMELDIAETATELITGGIAPWSCGTVDFQNSLIKLQKEKEAVYENAAATMDAEKILIVCDRGVLDSRAYMSQKELEEALDELGTNEVAERDHYDAVFHMVTAAKGVPEAYTLENNQARKESPEEAADLDDKLIAAWTGHPHLRVIDNSTGFEEKIHRTVAEIAAFLGEPEPMEIERKYLIRYPDIKRLEALPNSTRVDIVQTYLRSPQDGSEVRVRQRGQNGNFMCYRTEKKRISDRIRVEVERKIDIKEYISFLADADPDRRPIHKTRYCLTENSRYYEIDIYPEWSKQAIIEIELRDEHDTPEMPEGIEVIREVTDDRAYNNYSMAKEMPAE